MNKRNILLTLLALFWGFQALAQGVVRSDWQSLQLSFDAPQVQVGATNLFGSSFSTLEMEGYLSCNRPGEPDLPVLSRMIEVPLCEGFTIEITKLVADTIEGPSSPVAPCQPSRCKSDRSEPTLVMDAKAYARDAFTDAPLCEVLPVGVARSVNLAQVLFSPVRYNPVQNQLIVVRHAEVAITYRKPDIEGTRELAKHYSPAFATGVQTLNSLPGGKDITQAQQTPIHYLIVAHSMFRGQLDDFIAWKRRKGFIVTVGYTDQANVGTTTTSIANYIKSFYTNASAALPAPTYLLLVGDHQQLPAHQGQWTYSAQSAGQQVTDLYYATWTTGDLIPDCHYGRFSAQNISQLTPQVEKTLMYEQYTFADPSFLSRGILVAGVDQGTTTDNGYKFGDPAMDYAAREYVNAAQGFTTVTYYKNNTSFAPAGVTVTGSSQASGTAAALRTLYTQGAGWINYTAHGSPSGWYEPSFTTSHVPSMNNTQKFGFMIGNCCQTGTFNESECFGEALLRRGNYCGAVEYFGGSNVTYWYEDFYWSVGARNSSSISNTMNPPYDASHLGMYDRLFHTHNESFNNQYLTAGAMMMAGNMAVQASTSGASGKNYYWEIYHDFGDPSVMPWLGQAEVMTVQAPTTLPVGSTTLAVSAEPYAYCALTDPSGALVTAAFANANGSATLSLPSLNPGQYELAVSGQRYRTFFQYVTVFINNGPYVVASQFDATLNAGQPVQFTATLKNVGTTATDSLRAELQVNGNILTLNTPSVSLSNISDGDSLVLTALFSGSVAAGLADQTPTEVTLRLSWGSGENQSNERTYRFAVNAPDVRVARTLLAGSAQAGQTVTLTLTDKNLGHLAANNLVCRLVSGSGFATIQSGPTSLGTLQPGDSIAAQYTIVLAPNAPAGYLPLHHEIENTDGFYIDEVYFLPVGSVTEGFESGSFSSIAWNQGSYPWTIVNNASTSYAGSRCARSGSISHSQTSELSINWTAAIDDSISFYYNVSSEQNYDKFHFYIDGQDLLVVSGESGWTRAAFPVSAGSHTFTFAYAKDYSVSNGSDCAWIDQVAFPLSATLGGDSALGCAYTLPYACGFELESERRCWTALDQDGDGYSWQSSTSLRVHDGTHSMVSASYLNEVGPLTPDNWLISPLLTIPSEGATLRWFATAQQYDWSEEHYKVMLAPNGGSNPEDFTVTLYETTLDIDSGEWANPWVNIPDSGEVRLAFVHCNCTDMFWLCLDDISLEPGLYIPPAHHDTLIVETCDSYEWNDTTLTESGIYLWQGLTLEGGDSTLTLILTLHYSAFTELTVADTDSYLWNDSLYTASGDYNWLGETTFGCDSLVTLHLTILPSEPEGIGEADGEWQMADGLKVYPNPTSDYIKIQNPKCESQNVQVIDALGRVVLEEILNSEFLILNLSPLPSGTYLLRCGDATRKIIRK